MAGSLTLSESELNIVAVSGAADADYLVIGRTDSTAGSAISVTADTTLDAASNNQNVILYTGDTGTHAGTPAIFDGTKGVNGGNSINNLNRFAAWANGAIDLTLDYDSTGSYTLTFVPLDQQPPTVVAIQEVTPDPTVASVPFLNVEFSEEITASSFDLADLTLTRDGGDNLITGDVVIVQQSPTTYRVGGLTELTSVDGQYVLAVDTSGITDSFGNPGVLWNSSIQPGRSCNPGLA